jgi:hypothetical protein
VSGGREEDLTSGFGIAPCLYDRTSKLAEVPLFLFVVTTDLVILRVGSTEC